MYDHPEKTYVFVIDTNDSTDKFHKELTAALTGYVDETLAGEAESNAYCEAHGIKKLHKHISHIVKLPTSNGMTHCSPWQSVRNSPKKEPLYNSVGIFMNRAPTDEEMPILICCANEFADKHGFQITGFRVMHIVMSLWTDWKGKTF